MTKEFSVWFTERYLDWQKKLRRTATVAEFSDYLGLAGKSGQVTVGRWMNGKASPDYGNAIRIGLKLGIEVFDILGMPRPDPTLFMIWQHWDELSLEQQMAFREQLNSYLGENAAPTTAHTPF